VPQSRLRFFSLQDICILSRQIFRSVKFPANHKNSLTFFALPMIMELRAKGTMKNGRVCRGNGAGQPLGSRQLVCEAKPVAHE
jgi:hypothetical protein